MQPGSHEANEKLQALIQAPNRSNSFSMRVHPPVDVTVFHFHKPREEHASSLLGIFNVGLRDNVGDKVVTDAVLFM